MVRQHIEMKTGTCNLLWKDVPAFRKITGFRVWLPGEEHPGKWLITHVSLHMSLSSIIFELSISQLRKFLLIYPQCIMGEGKYFPFSYIWQNSSWCWSCACMLQHPPFTAAEINLKAISPISRWKENLHILKNAAIDLPLTREILLKWVSNTAVKFTAFISLQCKTPDNAIKCYLNHCTDLGVPFKWAGVPLCRNSSAKSDASLFQKIQVWCKVILVTNFYQGL